MQLFWGDSIVPISTDTFVFQPKLPPLLSPSSLQLLTLNRTSEKSWETYSQGFWMTVDTQQQAGFIVQLVKIYSPPKLSAMRAVGVISLAAQVQVLVV